jgi:hypothetical protein
MNLLRQPQHRKRWPPASALVGSASLSDNETAPHDAGHDEGLLPGYRVAKQCPVGKKWFLLSCKLFVPFWPPQ